MLEKNVKKCICLKLLNSNFGQMEERVNQNENIYNINRKREGLVNTNVCIEILPKFSVVSSVFVEICKIASIEKEKYSNKGYLCDLWTHVKLMKVI